MSISDPVVLTVQVPQPLSPDDSNETGSPSTHPTQSSTSLPTTANTSNANIPHITFAPLPLIEPRKRRSTSQVRLGVSSRRSLMRAQRWAPESPSDGEHRGREEGWGGPLQNVPPAMDIGQDDEISRSRTKKRSEQPMDSDVAILAVGRLVKSAWRRVSRSETRSSPSTTLNGSSGYRGLERELDTLNKRSSESDVGMRRQNSHDERVKVTQMPLMEDAEPLSDGSILLKLQKPVLVRRASEPGMKTTAVASTLKRR